MNLDDLFPSKFLSQNDVPQPIVLTIARLTQEEMKDKGATSKKPVVYFVEGMKPWILNKGNAKRIAALHGSDIAAWTGKRIEVYTDPMVEFAGEVVGGLRVRAPSQQQQQPAPAQFQPAPVMNGTGSVPEQPMPGARWDVWDGQNTATKTTEQLWSMIASGANPGTLRVKPVGTNKGRTAAEYGFILAPEPAVDDQIPW